MLAQPERKSEEINDNKVLKARSVCRHLLCGPGRADRFYQKNCESTLVSMN